MCIECVFMRVYVYIMWLNTCVGAVFDYFPQVAELPMNCWTLFDEPGETNPEHAAYIAA